MAQLADLELSLWTLICSFLDPRTVCVFAATCAEGRSASDSRTQELRRCLEPLQGQIPRAASLLKPQPGC